MFCRTYRQYFNGIKYRISKGSFIIKEETISFKDKKVFIDASTRKSDMVEQLKKQSCIYVYKKHTEK